MDMNIVDQKIDQLRENIISDLQTLVGIKSVVNKASGNKPFGDGVHQAFEFMLNLAEKENMDTVNVDNYGGHIDFGEGHLSETMGILCHLDVVPEGNSWTKDPFGGELIEGKIYGRGTIDDKGPTIACFYAMKALKELGFKPEKRVRMILGLDEETNWDGMKYYLSKVNPPDFGIAPDGDFPVIHGEMGIIVFDICKKIGRSFEKGIELRSLKGGNAANMVPDKARAVVNSPKANIYSEIKDNAERYKERTGNIIHTKAVGKSYEIVAEGVSAHGSMPTLGKNAIGVLMEFLGEIRFANEDVNDFIKFYNDHISYENNGKSLGCFLEDEISGELIVNPGVCEADKGSFKLTINARYPVTKSESDIYEKLDAVLDKYNLGLIKGNHKPPIYTPENSPFVKTLMEVFESRTGRKEAPLVIGGGTYARACPNVLAFGAKLSDQESLAHQKDEYIEAEHLINVTKIYAETIYKLSKDDKGFIE